MADRSSYGSCRGGASSRAALVAAPPYLGGGGGGGGGGERKPWWLSNRKIVDKCIRDARNLIATRERSEVASAISLLDSALALSPRFELALELKARSLLFLRRFKDVADMLQDYIPSLKMAGDDSGSVASDGSSQQLSKEQAKLLSGSSDSPSRDPSFKCFSVSDLKKKVLAGLSKSCDKEGQWRYLVLGKACCHLGLMEDSLVLLQTGKRLATDAFRRESVCWSDDSFSFPDLPSFSETITAKKANPRPTESALDSINQLLSRVKFLLRRSAAALAALDAGLYSEAIRHFTKIIDGKYGAPQGFLAQCYLYRASAYRSAGRIAESIADCNRTLALDNTCVQALDTRASLLETIRCLPDCLHDLEHLKLLYNTILRNRKLPGPAWKQYNVRYAEIPGKLCLLTTKIQELKRRVASGETGNVDYYSLIGLRRGCSRSELERAYLLLSLRHKPDRAIDFLDRCEFVDDFNLDSVKDRAKVSAVLLYRLLQKGYASVKATITEEEEAEKQRKKIAAALQAEQASIQAKQCHEAKPETKPNPIAIPTPLENPAPVEIDSSRAKGKTSTDASVYQGVFCRDLAAVGSLLSQVGFNRPLPVKYSALSC
ncbi:uncharacterized protein LOC104426813 [Eucalyptus grandis]|uniref:uncharacterized protein LOC104426813 n=1 Tax=Eucalyptus grandis TaxID=71139 RepID=UPI00192EA742|nr:uncharacterized protein LOC104426813 [Eucalyptus grandis]XP_039160905.1 uncharacterized protein LOC104426813 [Eucalyptus grandis]